jgi:hypothetical protein
MPGAADWAPTPDSSLPETWVPGPKNVQATGLLWRAAAFRPLKHAPPQIMIRLQAEERHRAD